MASLLLTWQNKKTGDEGFVKFDAVTAESWNSVMQITQHPVEEGSDIVDHARPEPERLTLEAYVSNKPGMDNIRGTTDQSLMAFKGVELVFPKNENAGPPLLSPGGLTKAATNLVSKIGAAIFGAPLPPKATVLMPTGDFPDRDRKVLEKLHQLRKERQLIKVYSRIAEMDNLLIESIGTPRSPTDGNGLVFNIEFMQVRFAKSETVPAPYEVRALPPVKKGRTAAQEAADKAKDTKSLLFQGGETFGFFGK